MRPRPLAALGLLLAGCSFVTVRTRPCTASLLPPIIDTASALTLGGLAVRETAGRDCGPDGCHTYDPTPLYLVPAVVFAAAAVYGWAVVVPCRREPAASAR